MFDPQAYGGEIAEILALDGNGERLMPLAGGKCSSSKARNRLRRSRIPLVVRAGLYVYFSCWEEAHELAQDLRTSEGSYWHAIVHRQEPDAWNSGYWFDRVGKHPIYPALCAEALALGVDFGTVWDPKAFIEYCERARTRHGSDEKRKALEVQRAEWQLLFDWVVRGLDSIQR